MMMAEEPQEEARSKQEGPDDDGGGVGGGTACGSAVEDCSRHGSFRRRLQLSVLLCVYGCIYVEGVCK
jgi:hypothetical protein